ncbi:hypothetical protein ACU4GD_37895 [Cupriavidus basilensis]
MAVMMLVRGMQDRPGRSGQQVHPRHGEPRRLQRRLHGKLPDPPGCAPDAGGRPASPHLRLTYGFQQNTNVDAAYTAS